MPLTVTSEPINTPVDLSELKDHLNLDGVSRFDSFLQLCINAIVGPAQEALGIQLIKATRQWTMGKWKQKVELPRPPLLSVSKVEYRDTAGTWQEVGASSYEVNTDAKPGFVRFINDYDVPDTYEDELYPWRYTYDCGFTDSQGASDYQQVPAELRLWMMNLIGTQFMKREADMIANSSVDVKELKVQMARLVRGHNYNVRFG